MITRVPLADVVQERAEHQQVGSGDPIRQVRRVRSRLPQVPIDGEAVVGVALRLGPHRRPFGQQPGEEVTLVERLEHGNGTVTFEEQGDQLIGGSDRPGTWPALHLVVQPIESRPADAGAVTRRRDGGLQDQRAVGAGIGSCGQLDLTVTKHHPGGDGPLVDALGLR